jgi:L,D-transpeptidase ErfK/SrfK
MGEFALYLGWSGYAIHGTDKPDSIGRRGSHGCLRMYPEDIAALFPLVAPGMPVTVVDQPVKVGWSGGELWLEVHPTQAEADILEAEGRIDTLLPSEVDGLVAKAAGSELSRVDWYAAHSAAQRRDGVAVPITRLRPPAPPS